MQVAMICYSGGRECDGCMSCQVEEDENTLYCCICNSRIDLDITDCVPWEPICNPCQEVISRYEGEESA